MALHAETVPLLKAYHRGWIVLSAAAVLYIATLLVRPDLVELQAGTTADALARRSLAAVSNALSGLQRDVADVRRSVALQERRVVSLEQERRPGEQAASHIPTAIEVPTPTIPIRIVNQQPPAKAPEKAPDIVTGSVTTPAAGPIAGPIAGPMGVQLAVGPSVEALRLSWALLQDRHKAALKGLEPRIGGSEANSFHLIAGPLSQNDAQRVCTSLKSRGVSCRPSAFAGAAL